MLADQAFCALRRSGAESRDDLEVVLEGAFGAFPVIAHQPFSVEKELAQATDHLDQSGRAGGFDDRHVEFMVDARALLEAVETGGACRLEQPIQLGELLAGDALGRQSGGEAFERLANPVDLRELCGCVDNLHASSRQHANEVIADQARNRLTYRGAADIEGRRHLDLAQAAARRDLAHNDGATQIAIDLIRDTVNAGDRRAGQSAKRATRRGGGLSTGRTLVCQLMHLYRHRVPPTPRRPRHGHNPARVHATAKPGSDQGRPSRSMMLANSAPREARLDVGRHEKLPPDDTRNCPFVT